MMKIQSFMLDSGGDNIFCSLFGESSANTSVCTIIFLPLFEERMWSHRIAYNFALQLAQKNNPVLIWDYFGYGESDGDSEDFTIGRCCQDTEGIIENLKKNHGFSDFIFLGIRTGGGIACHVINGISGHISGLVLWAPLMDFKGVVLKSLRSTISTQSYVFKKIVANRETILDELAKSGKCERDNYILNHIDGYRIGMGFYEEIMNFPKIDIPNKADLPIIYIDVIPQAKEAIFQKNEQAQREAFCDYYELTYNYVADREFWLNSKDFEQYSGKLYSKTMEWLESRKMLAV